MFPAAVRWPLNDLVTQRAFGGARAWLDAMVFHFMNFQKIFMHSISASITGNVTDFGIAVL